MSEFVNNLIKQLESSAKIQKGLQLVTSVIFPLAEGILINLATSATESKAYVWCLILIGSIHLIFVFLMFYTESLTPRFLIEYENSTKEVELVTKDRDKSQQYATAYNSAVTATFGTLEQIEDLSLNRIKEIEPVIEKVLFPWISQRSEIFFFGGDALYNFAVYMEKSPDLLHIVYRAVDDRLEVANREWRIGEGHVGQCFATKETKFLLHSTETELEEALRTPQLREEDIKYYRSMVATPIIVNQRAVGVLIITSSKSNQFDRGLHLNIVDVIGALLAQSIQYCWEDQNGNKSKLIQNRSIDRKVRKS